LAAAVASQSVFGSVKIGTGISVDPTGTISVDIPDIGVAEVIAGSGIDVQPPSGVGNVTVAVTPATAANIGGVKIGSGITVAGDGTISTVPAVPPRKLDSLKTQFNGTTSAFTLTIGGAAVTPPNNASVMIVLGGVVQTADDAYSVTGSTITFTGPPATNTEFYGVLF
jgi:hypothetical protein